jgi:signal transduction histidine kinase
MAAAAGFHLTKRLVDRFIVFGLTCVFLCISSAVILACNNLLTEWAAVTASLPLLSLLLGGLVLRRTIRLNALIEDQLCAVAQSGELEHALSPLAEPEMAAQGWNAILQRLSDQRAMTALEARLAGALGGAGGIEQQRWAAVFNVLSDGIAICDQRQTILQANNALAALVRVEEPGRLTGRNVLELLASAWQGAEVKDELAAGRWEGRLTQDIQLGEELAAGVLRVTRTPVAGDQFGPKATLWTVRDVTQQRLADEMRNQFVSTATHELRTPLTNIVAYAELLASETDLDVEKQKSFCNIIHAETSRLSRFVDQLLNVSQMEAGALSIARHETDIERLTLEVVENVQPNAHKKQLAFEAKLPPKLPKLRVDKDKLAASLVNLLGNAIKYTPEGGRVTLAVEVAAEQIHFHIEDTGIGIAAEELPRIAEKFFRSQDFRVREITGTGLGLAFAQEVARLHGGRLTVTSELDKGSRFTFSLPLT